MCGFQVISAMRLDQQTTDDVGNIENVILSQVLSILNGTFKILEVDILHDIYIYIDLYEEKDKW